MAKTSSATADPAKASPKEQPSRPEHAVGTCPKCGAHLMVLRHTGSERYAMCSKLMSGECDSRLIPVTAALEAAIKTANLPQATPVRRMVAEHVKGTPFYTQTIFRVEGRPGLYRRVAMKAGERVKLGPGEAIAVSRWRDGEVALGIADEEATEVASPVDPATSA